MNKDLFAYCSTYLERLDVLLDRLKTLENGDPSIDDWADYFEDFYDSRDTVEKMFEALEQSGKINSSISLINYYRTAIGAVANTLEVKIAEYNQGLQIDESSVLH